MKKAASPIETEGIAFSYARVSFIPIARSTATTSAGRAKGSASTPSTFCASPPNRTFRQQALFPAYAPGRSTRQSGSTNSTSPPATAKGLAAQTATELSA
jgi:hypothetical protein